MRDVAIVGTGTTPFGEFEGGVKEMGVKAASRALQSCGVTSEDVNALFLGNFVAGMLEGQEALAPLVADSIGLTGIPTMKTEGACASSGIAFRRAYQAIRTGEHDVIIAMGVENMTDADTTEFTRALGSAADYTTDGVTGVTFPGFYGLMLDRYLHEYDATREQIAQVSVKNRRNGAANPRARFQSEITVDDVLKSRLIADPLRLYDCCPAADGGAAVILAASDIAETFTEEPIPVLGSGHATGRSAAYRYDDLTTFEATSIAAESAYEQADVRPSDIDVVELHDCFSAAEVGDSEDLGFFEKGNGAAAVEAGRTAVDGEIPINPSGGLLAKGHPVGATGIGQIYEICEQLRGSHENQVEGAEIGLTHNLGGSGAIGTVTILGGPTHV